MIKNLIYGLVDPRTLLVRYIGLSTSGMRRPQNHGQPARATHKTYCANWVRSLQKLGLSYTIVVLEYAGSLLGKAALHDLERWWIAYGRASGWPLTNLTDGGDGAIGRVVGERERRLASERNRGDRNPAKRPDVRAKISASNKGMLLGVPKSAVTRARMSAAATGKKKPPGFGDKLRAIALSRPPMSDETRAKCAAASRRRWDQNLFARLAAEQNR